MLPLCQSHAPDRLPIAQALGAQGKERAEPTPADESEIGLVMAFALRISAICPPMLAQRGQELGIPALLLERPFWEVAEA